jgi:hypothetical protein
VIFRPFHRFDTGCAAYVFGCGGQGLACVVDPQERDVDAYIDFAAARPVLAGRKRDNALALHRGLHQKLLELAEPEFVAEVGGAALAKPSEMEAVLRFNQGRGA